MPVYAIGDLQGCYAPLRRLLDRLDFDPAEDRLWLAGDLVNRGPDSLACLRFVKQLGEAAISVLGNHDLHLLAIHAGHKTTRDAGLQAVLAAADAGELIDWLRRRPLLHYDAALDTVLVHAGVWPGWNLEQARQRARELETVLAGNDYLDFLPHMYGNQPASWTDGLQGWERLRFICNSFTRMRYCYTDGRLNLIDKGPPGSQREGSLPWFEIPDRKTREQLIVFGHWSSLGRLHRDRVYAIDTGCVWGGQLTALRLDHAEPGSALTCQAVDCPAYREPHQTLNTQSS